LKFLEDNHDGQPTETKGLEASFFNALDGAFNNSVTDSVEIADKTFVNIDTEDTESIMEPAIEKIKDIVAQMPEETAEVDAMLDAINDSPEVIEQDLNELSPSFAQLPIFDAVELDPPTPSLNDQLKTQGFQIGLNDRLAFVKNLFENSSEDYDRVLSQLSTLGSFEEASDLLNTIIKPDYNNWEGQEDIEARFLEIIEQKFK
jgi:hypothetical protein